MNVQIVAAIITAGTELLGEVIRNRQPTALTEPVDLSTLFPEPAPLKKKKPYFIIDPEKDLEEEDEGEEDVRERHYAPINVSISDDTESEPERETSSASPNLIINVNENPSTALTKITGDMVGKKVVNKPGSVNEVNAAEAIPTGCIPCSLGHVGTCSGLLNEATRFARSDGANSPEVIDRVNMCLDELNSLEREDLRPEKVMQLKGWEKDLAEKTLTISRGTRHKLEDVSNMSVDGLVKIAGETQSARQEIGRKWFQNKIASLSDEDQEVIKSRVLAKINEMREQAVTGNFSEDEIVSSNEQEADMERDEREDGRREDEIQVSVK